MKPPDYVWCAIGAGVLGWNIFCDPGMTLSERMDDWLLTHPVATRAAVVVVAIHLINAVPQRADIVHRGFLVLRLTRTPGLFVGVRRLRRPL